VADCNGGSTFPVWVLGSDLLQSTWLLVIRVQFLYLFSFPFTIIHFLLHILFLCWWLIPVAAALFPGPGSGFESFFFFMFVCRLFPFQFVFVNNFTPCSHFYFFYLFIVIVIMIGK